MEMITKQLYRNLDIDLRFRHKSLLLSDMHMSYFVLMISEFF